MEAIWNVLGAQISFVVGLAWVAVAIMLTYIRAFARGKEIGHKEGYALGRLSVKR